MFSVRSCYSYFLYCCESKRTTSPPPLLDRPNDSSQTSNKKTNQTNQTNELKISNKNYIFRRKRNPDDHATVARATIGEVDVAVKMFIPTLNVTENRRKNIKILNRELRILKALRNISPDIIHIYIYIEENNPLNPRIVMDLHPHSLYDLIKHEKQTVSTRFFSQTCNALTFLHKKKILHNDIKPKNILITSKGDAVIADFGCANYSSKSNCSNLLGTPGYWSPEMIARDRIPTTSSDCWSLCATWFFVLFGLELIDSTMCGMLQERHKLHSGASERTCEAYIKDQNRMIELEVEDLAGCFTSFFLRAFKVEPKERQKLKPAFNTVQRIINKNYQ